MQRALPEPIFVTRHLAPPVISALPDPRMVTEALPVALMLALPDPAIERSSSPVPKRGELKSHEPAIDTSITGRRPTRSLIRPSAGEATNCASENVVDRSVTMPGDAPKLVA